MNEESRLHRKATTDAISDGSPLRAIGEFEGVDEIAIGLPRFERRLRHLPIFRFDRHLGIFVEPLADAMHAECIDAARCEFDGECDAVEPATDLSNDRRRYVSQGKSIDVCCGPFDEKLHTREGERLCEALPELDPILAPITSPLTMIASRRRSSQSWRTGT